MKKKLTSSYKKPTTHKLQIKQGRLGLSRIQREYLTVSIGNTLMCKRHKVDPDATISFLALDIGTVVSNNHNPKYNHFSECVLVQIILV